MPKKPDYTKFFQGATEVIRKEGNPLNMHSSRMMTIVDRLRGVAEKKVLAPDELLKAANDAGAFHASQDALSNFSKGAGKEAVDLTAKYTRKGILASGAKAGTVKPAVLKSAGVAPGSSFSEIAEKASAAYEDMKPALKKLFKSSAAEIKAAAAEGVPAAIAAMKNKAFKFIEKGDLPVILLETLAPPSEIKAAMDRTAFQKSGA